MNLTILNTVLGGRPGVQTEFLLCKQLPMPLLKFICGEGQNVLEACGVMLESELPIRSISCLSFCGGVDIVLAWWRHFMIYGPSIYDWKTLGTNSLVRLRIHRESL